MIITEKDILRQIARTFEYTCLLYKWPKHQILVTPLNFCDVCGVNVDLQQQFFYVHTAR